MPYAKKAALDALSARLDALERQVRPQATQTKTSRRAASQKPAEGTKKEN